MICIEIRFLAMDILFLNTYIFPIPIARECRLSQQSFENRLLLSRPFPMASFPGHDFTSRQHLVNCNVTLGNVCTILLAEQKSFRASAKRFSR